MKFISHRGLDNHGFSENSLEGIMSCLNQDYISGVEIDIRLTKDEKIVVIHDSTINRVSDGSGFVEKMTLKELYKYNFGTMKNKSSILTLDYLLSRIKATKKDIIIEIKADSRIDKLINKITKIIKKYPKLSIIFSSFKKDVLYKLKNKLPNYKVGLISWFDIDKDNSIDFYLINYRYYKWKDKGHNIFLWTVNSEKDYYFMKKKLNNNIGIITDVSYKLKSFS